MVNFVSPGVYVIEKDISDYAPSINTSVVGVVGFAGKGPLNEATLITNQNNLIRKFGPPSEGIPGQGLEGSVEILEQTSQLYFIRAGTSTATDSSAIMQFGTCPSVLVSGNVAGTTDVGFGVTDNLYLTIQVYDNAGTAKFATPKNFAIPADTATSGQANAIASIVGGALDSDEVGCFDAGDTVLQVSGSLVGRYAGSGASIAVSAFSAATYDATAGMSALQPASALGLSANYMGSGMPLSHAQGYASSVVAYGASIVKTGGNSVGYGIVSLYEGDGYNGGTKTDGNASGNSITVANLGGPNFNVNINQDGVVDEQFKVGFTTSGNFIETAINTGETNTTSEIIKGNIIYENADVAANSLSAFGLLTSSLVNATVTDSTNNTFAMTTQWLDPTNMTGLVDGAGTDTPTNTTINVVGGSRWNKLIDAAAQDMAGGDNGTGSDAVNNTALIGDSTANPKTGMQALDEDELNIGIALVPGFANQNVQNALITLAEGTENFLALVSPPYAIGGVQDAIDWSNGKSGSTAGVRTAAINSSYAAIYWPWLKVFSVFDAKDRWLDPTIYAARQMAYTDTVADSWFAPAGYRRGRLTKPTEVEVKLNQGDRDSMYSGGNVLNPIVGFPQQGITIWGQRTTQRSPTALDRINVRRLMIYIRKIILIATQRFVFEPNDEFTWSQIEGVLNPFLDDIRRRRGITEFRVVCDETVNTPVRVDRNELWTKVLIKPTKTAEILIFEINLTNQSAQLGNL